MLVADKTITKADDVLRRHSACSSFSIGRGPVLPAVVLFLQYFERTLLIAKLTPIIKKALMRYWDVRLVSWDPVYFVNPSCQRLVLSLSPGVIEPHARVYVRGDKDLPNL